MGAAGGAEEEDEELALGSEKAAGAGVGSIKWLLLLNLPNQIPRSAMGSVATGISGSSGAPGAAALDLWQANKSLSGISRLLGNKARKSSNDGNSLETDGVVSHSSRCRIFPRTCRCPGA